MLLHTNTIVKQPGFGLFYVPCCGPKESPGYSFQLNKIEEQVVFADKNGWQNAWFAEHHGNAYGGLINAPDIICAYMAAKTQKIRLGPAICVLPLHDPRHLAERYALVDQLSNGRLDMGIGRGFLASELELFGIRMEDSKKRFKEAHTVLLNAWKNNCVDFSGEFYQYQSANIFPACSQTPHAPVWVAASNTRESFELAGRYGHHLMINPYTRTREEIEQGLEYYFSALQQAGIPKSEVRIGAMQHVYCGAVDDTLKQAFSYYLQALSTAAAGFSEKHNTSNWHQHFANITLEKVHSDKVLFGYPEDIIAKIEKWLSYGITDFCLMTQFGDLSWELSMQSLQLFTAHVIPYFSKKNITLTHSC